MPLFSALQENLEVEVSADNVLRISTSRKVEHSEEGTEHGWRFHRQERSSASASRTLLLPSCDARAVTASLEHGVLHIVAPKLAEKAQATTKVPVVLK